MFVDLTILLKNVVYNSTNQNMPFEFCCLTEVGLLKPDLVLLLDGSIGTHMERKDFGSEVYEKEHIQLKVKEAYKKHFLHEMEVVDEEGSMEEVHPRMMVCLEKHQVFDAATQPLQYMQSPSFNVCYPLLMTFFTISITFFLKNMLLWLNTHLE